MFAKVRETIFDPDKLRRGQAQMAEFAALLVGQPGDAGVVNVDAGDGRTLTVTLWESEAHLEAATAVLDREAARLVAPLLITPTRVLAQGPVLHTDLAKR